MNSTLSELKSIKHNSYKHLNVPPPPYHRQKLAPQYLDESKRISKSMLQKSKQKLSNLSFPNYIYGSKPTK